MAVEAAPAGTARQGFGGLVEINDITRTVRHREGLVCKRASERSAAPRIPSPSVTFLKRSLSS